MFIIPAVDIKNGKCVQLVQGKPGTEQIILDNPVEVALEWENRGASILHVIDLGGALEEGGNLSVVEEIVKEVSIPIQMGGGIRTIDDASYLLDMGVDKIILGTLAIQNPSTVHELSNEFGSERIIVALDSKDSQVVVRGWTEKTAQKAPELGKIMAEHGAGSILFTNVDHEGLLDGFKVQPLLELLKAVDIPVIYSGGVSTLEDVSVLNKTDVYGVVIGSALYKGALTFEDALIYGKK
ncbi:MAG: 1-(5-phosphoribosyl)-5-[(5-phosphoribosylamino)methylideneamino]imidazole-4-carboxamide isomerase [Methanobacterium sp.]|nr:1-(5-phosphoribosyl)-5-[(5-phosphoribosylamino)methylideneamino]imidazole-4-carboxamide isomerase [Methanobacterium sp.]